MVMKAGFERTLRKLGITQKQFVDQNPLQESEDEYQDIIDHADEYYDLHIEEQKARERIRRYKKHIKKNFPQPQETNLLTAATKDQIRYLHELDPVKWNPEALTQSFPISIDGVKKLLRSNYRPKSDSERLKHDNNVYKNIKLLKEGSEKISIVTRKLWEEGKLKIEYSQGNEILPMPDVDVEKVPAIKDFEKPGEFLSIVKPYLDAKKQQESKDIPKHSEIIKHEDPTKNNFLKIVIPSHIESSDPLCATYFPSRFKSDDALDITHEQCRPNFTKDDNTTDITSRKEQNLINNKENTNNSLNFKSGNVPKYNNDNVEFVLDSRVNQNLGIRQPYVYDSKVGYQHPLGEAGDYPEKIEIPKDDFKPGALYKVGNCYYDDNGDFLYRVFS